MKDAILSFLCFMLAATFSAGAQNTDIITVRPQKHAASTHSDKETDDFAVRYNTVMDFAVPEGEREPSAKVKKKIKKIAEFINSHDDVTEVWICGFHGYRGSDNYVLKLSEKRAECVKDLLTAEGVDPTLITTQGKGKNITLGDGIIVIVCNSKKEPYQVFNDFLDAIAGYELFHYRWTN